MLSDQTISTAGDQVRNMEMRGFYVAPLPGSLLDSAVKACHIDSIHLFQNQEGEYDLQSYDLRYAANTVDSVTGNCEHTLTQAELAAMVAPKVTGYLAHARTVVAPAVEEFVRHLDEAVSIYRGQIAHDFEILTQALPSPLADSSILDSIKKGEAALPREFDMPIMGLPALAGDAIAALMQTGSPTLDAAIAAWADTKGPVFIGGVWEQLFSDSPSVRVAQASAYFQDTQEGNDRLMAAFLFCRKMWDNPGEGTQLSLANYNEKIAELRLQVATRLNQRITNAERAEKAGNLVISSFGRKIVVNQSVYTKWLQAGGTNEVLLGNALKSNPSVTVADIDADAEASKAAWARYAAINSVNFANRMFTKYKDAAEIEFSRTIAAASHDEMPLHEREDILRRFKAALNMSRPEETKNMFAWGLRLLATSWFYKTDAYRILKSISDIREANPELEAREAAAIAAIDYISFWVSSQMTLQRLG